MLQLYMSPGSSSMAPHIALVEAGAEFELVPISFSAREQRGAHYLALNPAGKVPTLILDDGQPLTEVLAILWYIAKRYPDARLLPEGGPEAEAQVLSWMSFIASAIHPASYSDETRQKPFDVAENMLGEREWAVGNRMSLADIHLFRLFWRNHVRGGFELAKLPRLSAHYDRMMAQPSVKQVIEIESAIGYELPK